MAKEIIQKGLVALYKGGNAVGLWDTALMRRAFVDLYFFYKRFFEDPYEYLERTRPDVFRNGHILDVGANIGYTATLFARVVEPGYRIFAFEPEQKNFGFLQETIRRRRLESNVTLIHVAVGAAPGTSALWYNPAHAGDHRVVTDVFQGEKGATDIQNVPMVSLDSFADDTIVGQPVSFIKIDVQGYETEVCAGMGRLLARNPDAVLGVEYAPSGIRALGFSSETLVDFFRSRDYHVYLLTRRGLVATEYAQLTQEPKNGYADLIFSKRALLS